MFAIKKNIRTDGKPIQMKNALYLLKKNQENGSCFRHLIFFRIAITFYPPLTKNPQKCQN